jgi:ketosteroid isomerase-like protein
MQLHMKKFLIGLVIGFFVAFAVPYGGEQADKEGEQAMSDAKKESIVTLVTDHARAWEEDNLDLFLSTIHEDILFAYPGRRLNKQELIEDYKFYHESFKDTNVYIHNIIVDGDMVSVEWQFAMTEKESGKRTATSDGIIGKIQDGKIILWKEYLDGRVSRMQKVDALALEEGEAPFPSPLGSLRQYCDVAC